MSQTGIFGAVKDFFSYSGKTLKDAIDTGDLVFIRGLIEYGVSVNQKCAGEPSLIYAIKKNIEIVKLLLELGASVDYHDENGQTALFYAVSRGIRGVAILLLEHGANIDERDHAGNTPLAIAVHKNYPKTAANLLSRGADVNQVDVSGKPMLAAAVLLRQKPMIELLLSRGAKVDLPDKHGKSALMLAFEQSYQDMVELLMRSGANINFKDRHGQTALMLAVKNGNEALAQLILNHGPDLNQRDTNGDTLLSIAVKKNHKIIIEILLDQGVDINLVDEAGRTALMCAVANQNKALMMLLIKRGAKLNMVDRTAKTALLIALENDDAESLRILLAYGASVDHEYQGRETIIFAVVKQEKYYMLQPLLDHGAKIDHVDQHGQTALMLAVTLQKKQAVHLLLQKKARLDIKTNKGLTALMLAVSLANEAIVKLLLAFGADVNQTYPDQKTLLMEAVRSHQHTQILEALLAKGAKVDILDSVGETALMIAVKQRGYEMLRVLLKAGANPNLPYPNQDLPLTMAARWVDLPMMRTLLQHGANVDQKANSQNAIMIAVEDEHKKMVTLLLEHGANPNQHYPDGQTLLMLAVSLANEAIVKLLLASGADVNQTYPDQKTLLMEAVRGHERTQILEALLAKGAKVDVLDSVGETALIMAVKQRKHAMVTILLTAGANPNQSSPKDHPLTMAARWVDLPMMRTLLQHGANVDQKANSQNAIMIAVEEEYTKMVTLLLKYGANPNQHYPDGQTLLNKISERGHHEILQKLLDYGGLPDAFDAHGNLPISLAVEHGHDQVLRVLLAKGVDVNTRTKEGLTLLILAVKKRHKGLVRVLLEYGALNNPGHVYYLLTNQFLFKEFGGLISNIMLGKIPAMVPIANHSINTRSGIFYCGESLLGVAVSRKHLAMGVYLLTLGASNNLLLDWCQDTAVQRVAKLSRHSLLKKVVLNPSIRNLYEVALRNKYFVLVNYMLQQKLISSPDEYAPEILPLHLAAQSSSLRMVEVLLSHHANPFLKDSNGILAEGHTGFSSIKTALKEAAVAYKSVTEAKLDASQTVQVEIDPVRGSGSVLLPGAAASDVSRHHMLTHPLTTRYYQQKNFGHAKHWAITRGEQQPCFYLDGSTNIIRQSPGSPKSALMPACEQQHPALLALPNLVQQVMVRGFSLAFVPALIDQFALEHQCAVGKRQVIGVLVNAVMHHMLSMSLFTYCIQVVAILLLQKSGMRTNLIGKLAVALSLACQISTMVEASTFDVLAFIITFLAMSTSQVVGSMFGRGMATRLNQGFFETFSRKTTAVKRINIREGIRSPFC